MRLFGFDEISASLGDLDSWLASLGIQPKTDRWHEAVKMVQRAKTEREKFERGEARSPIPNYMHGLFEALEALEVYRAFRGDSSPALREKLQRALSGPIAPPDEQPKNSAGRNAMFELFLAADWKNEGLTVDLGEPDIVVHVAGSPFMVECKRPFFENSVWRNIGDAASQLGKELDKPENSRTRGIVAISLSRVFTQNDLACFASEDEGKQFITNALKSIVDTHHNDWHIRQFLSFNVRIVAVMFHLAVPWDIGGEKLIHASRSRFIQAGRDLGVGNYW
jgi:hypothetical protein